SMLVLFSTDSKLYSNDVDYVYRQENNLYYLTNLAQNGAALVMTKNGADIREAIFLPKRNPARETWNGKMYSNEQAASLSGIKTIVNSAERADLLNAIKAKGSFSAKEGGFQFASAPETIYMLLPFTEGDRGGQKEFRAEFEFSGQIKGAYKVENARPIFAALRLIKSPYELAKLQHAIDITTEAQMRAMSMVGQAKMEYEVQAEVEYTFRRRNADFWGYPSIVGCGPNATTLHYEEAQGAVKAGDVLLMDVGAEYDHYTADVTRTFPVNGKFSREQAEIYQIVYDTQEAAAKATKPGATIQIVSAAADQVMKDGLFRLGLITDKNSQQFKIWYMHGLSHWLGMNVHDVGSYGTPLAPGMVFTNEPGIYIREDALEYLPDTPENKAFIAKVRPAFDKYKNIGVRIEDDMLVTPTGVEWMTKKLPRKMDEIEGFMAKASRENALLRHEHIDPTGSAPLSIGNYSYFVLDGFDPFLTPAGVTVRRRIKSGLES
ncbi:MAG: aminopeptidase P family protein, partial [Acidobacteriota bacterium]